MATKEELKSKLGQVLEQRRAERAEALAPVQAQIEQIKELIAAGDTRQAYRIFEELPILDQLAISLTPGVGDALAVFETGEFGTRAGERFEQDDTLGGLGNIALSGLSAASTIPVIGALPTVAKTLTRVGKVADDIPGGGGGALTESPLDFNRRTNEYVMTRAKDPATGNDIIGSGLISPNRKVLGDIMETDNVPMKLPQLVNKVRKLAPGKEGDLRQLGVIDDRNNLTPEIVQSLGMTEKVSPAALDNFMRRNQDGFVVTKPPTDEFQGINIGDIGQQGKETQRVYQIAGLEPKTTAHYNYDYPAAYAFDSTDELANGMIRLNRQQSDYSKELQKLAVKQGENKQRFDPDGNATLTADGDMVVDFMRGSPFKIDGKPYKKPDIDEIMKDLEPLIDKRNAVAAKINAYNFKTFDKFFNPDGSLKLATDIQKIPKSELKEIGGSRINEELYGDLNKIEIDIKRRIGRDEEKLRPELATVYDKDLVPAGLGKILDNLKTGLERTAKARFEKDVYASDFLKQNTNYNELTNVKSNRTTQQHVLNIDPKFYGLDLSGDKKLLKKFATLRIEGRMDPNDIYDNVKSSIDLIDEVNRDSLARLYDKDPFATKTGTNAAVYPTRYLVNELARETKAPAITFDIEQMANREMFGKRKNPREQYANTVKEFEKIIKELELPKDTLELVTGKKRVPGKGEGMIFSGEWQFKLDPVREALAKGKKISLMKSGGPVDIDSLLNNL